MDMIELEYGNICISNLTLTPIYLNIFISKETF